MHPEIMDLQKNIRSHEPEYIGLREYAEAAVLIPLLEKDGEIQVLFEIRSGKLRRQPGEICFPGGKLEAGEGPAEAALRETCEELLIKPEQVELLGACDRLLSSHLIVHSFVGSLKDYEDSFNTAEVASVFTVPLERLLKLQPETFPLRRIADPNQEVYPINETYDSGNYPWVSFTDTVYKYEYQGHVIWGMTAKILRAFLEIIGKGRK